MKACQWGFAVLGLSLGLPFLAGCDTGGTAVLPPLTPPPAAPAAPVSTIDATLQISAADLARLLNDNTAAPVANLHDHPIDCAIGKCRLTLDARRAGPAAVTADDGRLHISLPFALDAAIALPGIMKNLHGEAHTSGRAEVSTDLALSPDWHLRTRTDGTIRLNNGNLSVGPLKTDLANVWNANAELLSHPLFRQIDKKLAADAQIARQAGSLWRLAARPIKIAAAPPLWLTLQPERIRIAPPEMTGNTLSIALGIDVRAQTFAQETPPAVPAPATLPAPAPRSAQKDSFRIYMPFVLSYDEAARLALAELTKKPMQIGGRTLSLTKLQIVPSGEDVVVAATFCLNSGADVLGLTSACGVGYLRGVPSFDAAHNVIRVDHLHYVIQKEDFLLSTGRALAAGDIERAMAKGLSFDVDKQLRASRQQLEKALAGNPAPKGAAGLQLSGHVARFGAQRLTWTKDGFLAQAFAEGDMRVAWHP